MDEAEIERLNELLTSATPELASGKASAKELARILAFGADPRWAKKTNFDADAALILAAINRLRATLEHPHPASGEADPSVTREPFSLSTALATPLGSEATDGSAADVEKARELLASILGIAVPDARFVADGVFDFDCAIRAIVTALSSSRAEAWQPIETAPRDGTMLWLAVDYTGGDGGAEGPDHALADVYALAATIGSNGFDDDGEDEWKFAGWCWSHDHFTQGRGRVVAWRHIGLELNLDDDPAIRALPVKRLT